MSPFDQSQLSFLPYFFFLLFFGSGTQGTEIIATTQEHDVAMQSTEACSISDHDLTGVIVKKNCQKFKPRRIFIRNYAKYNDAYFKEDPRIG